MFRRRRYLVDRFQTRYALAVVLVTAFVSAVTSLVLFRVLTGARLSELTATPAAMDHNARWLLLWVSVLIACSFALFFLLIILASHRIAGPLAVMTQYMSEFAAGKYPQIRELRKSDEMRPFFSSFKTAVDRFRTRDREEIALLQSELRRLKGLKLGSGMHQLESILQLMIGRRLETLGREASAEEPEEAAAPSKAS